MKNLLYICCLLFSSTSFAIANGAIVNCSFTQYSHIGDETKAMPKLAQMTGFLSKSKEFLELKLGTMEGLARYSKNGQVILSISNLSQASSNEKLIGIMKPRTEELTIIFENLDKDPNNDFRLVCNRRQSTRD